MAEARLWAEVAAECSPYCQVTSFLRPFPIARGLSPLHPQTRRSGKLTPPGSALSPPRLAGVGVEIPWTPPAWEEAPQTCVRLRFPESPGVAELRHLGGSSPAFPAPSRRPTSPLGIPGVFVQMCCRNQARRAATRFCHDHNRNCWQVSVQPSDTTKLPLTSAVQQGRRLRWEQ